MACGENDLFIDEVVFRQSNFSRVDIKKIRSSANQTCVERVLESGRRCPSPGVFY